MIKVRETPPLKALPNSKIYYLPKVKDPFIKYVSKVSFKQPDNLWTKFDFNKWPHQMTIVEMLCIESYCCGFLTYYSYIVRSRLHDFKQIHFCWEIKTTGNTKYYQLTVYLDPRAAKGKFSTSPASQMFLSDPPQPPYPPPPPMG